MIAGNTAVTISVMHFATDSLQYQLFDSMSGPGRAEEAHPSLGSAAHEEEPRNAMDVADDLLNHLTATQLLYTLHRVHHLCYHVVEIGSTALGSMVMLGT